MDKKIVYSIMRKHGYIIDDSRIEELLPLIDMITNIIKSNHLSCYEAGAVFRSVEAALRRTNL